ncbi:MAG: hypothetical protein ABIK09_18250 [Pseudomonadota bacterium]
MMRSLVVLTIALLLTPSCLESNPQPSPVGHDGEGAAMDTAGPAPGEDAALPGGDVVGWGEVAISDTECDGAGPPEDAVPADAVDITPDLLDVLTDLPDVCVPSCTGPDDGPKECGDDGCGGSCGACINNCDPCGTMGGPFEDPNLCMEPEGLCAQVCCPLCCDGLECGDDGCGGACGMCDDGEICADNHCEADDKPCGDPEAYADCTSDLDADPCAEAGGTFGQFGLSPVPFCLCPSGDGGCPCDGPGDCVGICWAPIDGGCQELTAGTCSETTVMFGCFCIFQEEGEAWGICID